MSELQGNPAIPEAAHPLDLAADRLEVQGLDHAQRGILESVTTAFATARDSEHLGILVQQARFTLGKVHAQIEAALYAVAETTNGTFEAGPYRTTGIYSDPAQAEPDRFVLDATPGAHKSQTASLEPPAPSAVTSGTSSTGGSASEATVVLEDDDAVSTGTGHERAAANVAAATVETIRHATTAGLSGEAEALAPSPAQLELVDEDPLVVEINDLFALFLERGSGSASFQADRSKVFETHFQPTLVMSIQLRIQVDEISRKRRSEIIADQTGEPTDPQKVAAITIDRDEKTGKVTRIFVQLEDSGNKSELTRDRQREAMIKDWPEKYTADERLSRYLQPLLKWAKSERKRQAIAAVIQAPAPELPPLPEVEPQRVTARLRVLRGLDLEEQVPVAVRFAKVFDFLKACPAERTEKYKRKGDRIDVTAYITFKKDVIHIEVAEYQSSGGQGVLPGAKIVIAPTEEGSWNISLVAGSVRGEISLKNFGSKNEPAFVAVFKDYVRPLLGHFEREMAIRGIGCEEEQAQE